MPEDIKMDLKKALLVVDVQNDFCPDGALAVPEGDKIIPNINRYIKIFSGKGIPVFITRDWHPKDTKHFKKLGGTWPEHCIQDTKGAEFHPDLKAPADAVIVSKGMNPEEDSYSAFQAADSGGRKLPDLLKDAGINELFIGGIATDYCVRYTALDALKAGFKVNVLTDAIKGVDLKPGDSKKAIEEIVSQGAILIDLNSKSW